MKTEDRTDRAHIVLNCTTREWERDGLGRLRAGPGSDNNLRDLDADWTIRTRDGYTDPERSNKESENKDKDPKKEERALMTGRRAPDDGSA